MSSTFVFRDPPYPAVEGKRKVLVTGAAGRIGSHFAEHSKDRYDLRLMVRGDEAKVDEIKAFGEVVQCNLSDLAGLTDICEGIDTVVHLAADHRTFAPWEELLPNNLIGTYHMYEAALAKGCRRVIFASSAQAVCGFMPDLQLRPEDPCNPVNLYGVTKCYGEAMSRRYTHVGLSGIVLRICAHNTYQSMRHPACDAPLWAFVSPRDLTQLIGLCVDDNRLLYGLFYGISNNTPNLADLTNARQLLGYAPIDNIFDEQP